MADQEYQKFGDSDEFDDGELVSISDEVTLPDLRICTVCVMVYENAELECFFICPDMAFNVTDLTLADLCMVLELLPTFDFTPFNDQYSVEMIVQNIEQQLLNALKNKE